MKWVLFKPFDFGKWFVLGFTAWLAGLLDSGGSGGSGGSGDSSGGADPAVEEFFRDAAQWVEENLATVIGIGIAVFFLLIVIWLLLLWISSRGKFMFLDNVIHNRAMVKAPWRDFRAQGNSLFCWKIGFTIIAILAIFVIASAGIATTISMVKSESESAWLAAIPFALVFLAAVLALAYITILLEDFVIPLMYRDSLSTTEAWRRLLTIHREGTGRFILYVLWKLVLGIGAAICIIAAGIVTCCIGFIIMVLPYLGAVLLLPVSVFFRLLGPEFLRQFGHDYDILPSTQTDPAPLIAP